MKLAAAASIVMNATVVACHSQGPVEGRRAPPPAVLVPAVAPLSPGDEPTLDAGPTDIEPPTAEFAPLPGPTFETWRADDFDVVASLPVGARERRPIVVGVHGSHDRPDAACARWRRTLAGFPFVVCPQGVPFRGGLAWGSPAALAERIDRAVAGLRERYGAYIADGPVIYAGWSLGATLGPKVVALRPAVFGTVVLAEIGHTRVDAAATAASIRTGRASYTIVACATRRCAAFAQRLGRANKTVKGAPTLALVDAGIGRGHVFDDRMAGAIGAAIASSVTSDPRWSGLAAALERGDAGLPDEPLPPVDDEPDLAAPP